MDDSFCILILHGTKHTESQIAKNIFFERIKNLLKNNFSICYLKENSPSLLEALENAKTAGFNRIICLPLFVLPGAHTTKDIPAIIKTFTDKYPECHVKQLPCLTENGSFPEFIAKTLGKIND